MTSGIATGRFWPLTIDNLAVHDQGFSAKIAMDSQLQSWLADLDTGSVVKKTTSEWHDLIVHDEIAADIEGIISCLAVQK